MPSPLTPFHPLIQDWFRECVGEPTEVQTAAWPVISAGGHVLVSAPTGTGKTLTAFLWALNQLLSGAWTQGGVRVLYISPLKALNNDIQQNLLHPLGQLRHHFATHGAVCPEVRVMVRSGDTEQSERQRMLRKPPEILITTPESLNLLLSSPRAQGMFTGLRTVILDEIHAVAGEKRGTHLISAVDRLVLIAGEFQRVALSATVKPLDAISAFVGGYTLETMGGEPVYRPRKVTAIACTGQKTYDIQVRFPSTIREAGESGNKLAPFLPHLAGEFREVIKRNTSTLIFTNNRRHSETLSMLINDEEDSILAYSHHGSLSREIRHAVEQRLKNGELKAIVATSSLEMGIDIGALDEVILLQTPFSVASAIQRAGRAGHQVGAVSKATIYPLHGRDILDAAVMTRCIHDRVIEEIQPISCPLDVLAQVLTGMVGISPWHVDSLYAFIKTTWPYHDLPRRQFDLIVQMLAGRYRDSKIRALDPLVTFDAITGMINGKDGALRILYSSGGTITDRGDFVLRRADNRARIGELDEEFVWESRPGNVFTLGVQSWRIREVTHNDVLVDPAPGSRAAAPFWKADEQDRSYSFSERIALFCEENNNRLDSPELLESLERDHSLDYDAARALLSFLHIQRKASPEGLPHRRHILIEYHQDEAAKGMGPTLIVHTLWGGRINRPLSFAFAQAWEERNGVHLDVFCTNDSIIAIIPPEFERTDFFELVPASELERLLRARLEQTGFFGARFRENASRALLLPKKGFQRRTPRWVSRMKSRNLLQAITQHADFPILYETWRTCLRDAFDLDTLRSLLDEVATGQIHVSEIWTSHPTPFADSAIWRMTNAFLYGDDSNPGLGVSSLSDDLLKEAVFQGPSRPRITVAHAREFEEKVQRLHPGYLPRDADELVEWVKERLFIPQPEWDILLDAMSRQSGVFAGRLIKPVASRLARAAWDGGEGIVALELAGKFARAFDVPEAPVRFLRLDGSPIESLPELAVQTADPEDESPQLETWLGEWLRYYGPRPLAWLAGALPGPAARLMEALDSLEEERLLVSDPLTEGAGETEICDSENLEILLRQKRARARAQFDALPVSHLPVFLASWQHLAGYGAPAGDLQSTLDPLIGCPLQPALLESEILPARIHNYRTTMLDALVMDTEFLWLGMEGKRILLAFATNWDLFLEPREESPEQSALWLKVVEDLFASAPGQRHFEAMLARTRLSSEELTASLWEFVWESRVTNDTFSALRRGIENKFRAGEAASRPTPADGRHARRWAPAKGYPGAWMILTPSQTTVDLLDAEERIRERVRILLDRYGVLFREILTREAPLLRWSAVFPALRRMELAGEVVAGSFFRDVPGVQFASHAAFRMLQQGLDGSAIFWVNAADPASLCGVDLEWAKASLPPRIPGNHVVYQGAEILLVSRRNGKDLDIRIPPDDPRLDAAFTFMKSMLTRSFQRVASITIETINGEPAIRSPYVTWLRDILDVCVDSKVVHVWKNDG